MALSGNQAALMYAYLGNATSNPSGTGLHRPLRLGASRLGYYKPHTIVRVNGVLRQGNYDDFTWRVNERLWDEPDEATIDLFGFTPVEGQELIIAIGSIQNGRIFRGPIVTVDRVHNRLNEGRLIYTCRARDWGHLFDRRLITRRWTSTSGTTIAQDIVSTYTSGFSAAGIQQGLPSLDSFELTFEDPSTAFSRLARRLGAYWEIREDKVVWLWTGSSGLQNPATITNAQGAQGNRAIRQLRYRRDLGSVATRVIVEGNGSSVVAAVGVGATTLPIEDAAYFSSGGGRARLGMQVIDYTGLAGTGGAGSTLTGSEPNGTNVQLQSSTGGSIATGTIVRYRFTFQTAAGETLAGLPSTSFTVVSGDNGVGIGSTPSPPIGIPIGPTGTTGRRIYRSDNSGAYGLVQTISDNTTTGTNDFVASPGAAPPATDTSGLASRIILVQPGATSLPVRNVANFSSAGGWVRVADQVVRFTGRSVSIGAGNLTGVPASGVGAVLVAISGGAAEIINHPHLTGVTGLVEAVNVGDEIQIIVTRDDATAQTVLAAIEGGDGIHEKFEQDRRLNRDSCEDLGDATLSMWKNVLEEIEAVSSDPHASAGRELTVNVSEWLLNLTLRIQTATVRRVEGHPWPQRTIHATTQLRSLYDILRGLQDAAVRRG